jgi:NADPH:quinone reductase-like Zn-dependent oxidoreductase
MKAARFSRFGGPEVLQIVDLPDPHPGPGQIGELTGSGRFSLPVAQTFPLAEIAAAHRASEDGHVRGKLVLVVG